MGFSEVFYNIKSKKGYDKIRKSVENMILKDVDSPINIYGVMKVRKDIKMPLMFFGQNCGEYELKQGEIYAWVGGEKAYLRKIKGKGFEIPANIDDYLSGFLNDKQELRDNDTLENENFAFFKVKNGLVLKFENEKQANKKAFSKS